MDAELEGGLYNFAMQVDMEAIKLWTLLSSGEGWPPEAIDPLQKLAAIRERLNTFMDQRFEQLQLAGQHYQQLKSKAMESERSLESIIVHLIASLETLRILKSGRPFLEG